MMGAVPRTTLGRTGLEVGRLSLGAWGFQNPAAPEPARIDDPETLREVISASFDAGMNLIDSAEVYANETLLGEIVNGLPNRPTDLVVSTKFGHGKGFSGEQIVESVERSLEAWGIPSIPLFMLHDPRTADDMATIAAADGALPALRRLQDQGLVGSIGIATGTLEPLLLAVESDEYDVIQFPRLYTLLNGAAKTSGLLEKAKAKNIGTILTSPFTGNILGTGVRGVEKPFYSFFPAIDEVVEAVARLEAKADELGISLPTAAVAYPAQEELIDVIVLGVTSVRELEEDIAAMTADISPEALAELAAAGAIDPHYLGGPQFTLPFPADRRDEVFARR